jgi:hypothetical protein
MAAKSKITPAKTILPVASEAAVLGCALDAWRGETPIRLSLGAGSATTRPQA